MDRHPRELDKRQIRRLVGTDTPLILEVGCNDGLDTAELLAELPQAELHCFEPDPRPRERFRARLRPALGVGAAGCYLHPIALGETDGYAPFHPSGGLPPRLPQSYAGLTDWDLSGSLRQPTGHLQRLPWCKFGVPIEVAVRRLDSWAAEVIPGRTVDFLWADVQGAEGDLLRGGRQTLQQTRYLYSEFDSAPLYAGQLNLDQILALLGPAWQLLGVYGRYNFLVRNEALACS